MDKQNSQPELGLFLSSDGKEASQKKSSITDSEKSTKTECPSPLPLPEERLKDIGRLMQETRLVLPDSTIPAYDGMLSNFITVIATFIEKYFEYDAWVGMPSYYPHGWISADTMFNEKRQRYINLQLHRENGYHIESKYIADTLVDLSVIAMMALVMEQMETIQYISPNGSGN